MIFQGNEYLQEVRYLNYRKMVASSNKINPSQLPLTEKAAWFHSLRTYLQILEWKTLKDCLLLEITDWGWEFKNGEVVPIITDQVISFHYSWYRGTIRFLIFYGSPCILIIIGMAILLLLF